MGEIMKKRKIKEQNFERGALILLVSTVIVKIIGAVFKIPLQSLIGDLGFGYFSSAYDLFLPIYALSMAGLPIAVSRLTAANVAQGKLKDARKTLKISQKAFLVTGVAGFIIMLCTTYFYAVSTTDNINDAKNVAICVLMIAPTILFCSYMSAYRGYYEGLHNMYPTAISDVIEALGKLILGFSFAYIVLKITSNVALAAAGALAGIMIGTVVAAAFLVLRHKFIGDSIEHSDYQSAPDSSSGKMILKALLVIAVPVALSSLANNITLFIDTFMVKWQLKNVMLESFDYISNMYASSVADYNASASALGRELLSSSNMPTFLYGIRGEAYVFYNLIPTITATLGIGSVPFLTTVWVEKNNVAVKKTMETILRTTAVIAIPAGLGLCAIAPNVMGLLYVGVAPVEIGAPILRILGIAAVFSGLSVPMTNMLQAIGKPMLPVRNIAIGAAFKIIVNAILVGRPQLNIMGAPIGTTICYILIFILNLSSLIKYTGVKINFVSVIIKPFISGLSCAACAFLVSSLVTNLSKSDFLATICGVGVAVIIYLVVLFALKTLTKEDIEGFPKGKIIANYLEKLHIIK